MNQQELFKIPIQTEYKYLGIKINNQGSILPHLQVIIKRAQYIIDIMKFYTHSMQFHNQNLLWVTYIKPYFKYMAAVLDSQANIT